jgi:hypothetical protein
LAFGNVSLFLPTLVFFVTEVSAVLTLDRTVSLAFPTPLFGSGCFLDGFPGLSFALFHHTRLFQEFCEVGNGIAGDSITDGLPE